MTTYTPVNRPLPPRFGILVTDGVGTRQFWYARRKRRDAEMHQIAAMAGIK